MDIVEFLRARLSETLTMAQRHAEALQEYTEGARGNDHVLAVGAFMYGLDPAQVLRDVEAKERIIDLRPDSTGEWNNHQTEAGTTVKEATLRILALPYATHPDYQTEWAPR